MPLVFQPGGRTTPPPRMTETVVDAWAHCGNPRCEGYGQQPVAGVHTVVEHTIGSRGGDGIFMNIVENTNEYLRFALNGCDSDGNSDPAEPNDIPCEHCGADREITLQQRPVYQGLSGFPQNGLLQVAGFDPRVQNSQADEAAALASAEQNKRMAELEATVAKLTHALGGEDAVG